MRLAMSLFAAMLLLVARGSAAPSGGSEPHVTQAVLANGLRVVVIENHAAPLANVAMWYRFGSADDPPGHQGLAHALEHMMFRGTRALSGAGLDLAFARLGIYANAETDFESTHYYQAVPVGELAVALHVEADRMHGLTLSPRIWQLERGAVLAELSRAESKAGGAVQSAVRRAAYAGTPFAHDELGTERALLRTTAADLRHAYQAAYQPDNATLVVTGDVVPDTVVQLARALFGPLHGHARLTHPRATPPGARGFTTRLGPFDEDAVDVALEAHGEAARDAPAEEVAAELIGPAHAALRKPLIEDGPCWSFDVNDDRNIDGGLYHLICHPAPWETPRDAVRAIRLALRRLAAHPPAATEIAYARRADYAAGAFDRDSLQSEADYFGGSIALLHADPRRGEAANARVPDAAVIAVLRRWGQPVGVGIATAGKVAVESAASAPRERLEHIAPALDDEVVVEPPWTRAAPRDLHAAKDAAVDTFALPNGVRVFVEPRRGNGTLYVRAGLDEPERGARIGARRAIVRTAERHAIVLDPDAEIGMHGFTGELPTMLGFVAQAWRTPAFPRRFAVLPLRAPRPEHAWIAIAGDVDPLTVRARTAALFDRWRVAAPRKPSPSPEPRTPKARRPIPRRTIVRVETSDVRAMLAQRAPQGDDPDRIAMRICNEILGADGDMDSRLAGDVRRRRGLVYMVRTYYDTDEGLFYVMFDAPRRRFRAARAAVRNVLTAFQTHPVTAEELERARHKLLAKALRAESEPDRLLDRLAAAARDRTPVDDFATIAARYGAVTLADVRRVARAHMNVERMVELDEGPVP